jgi:hypothetical protein
MWWSGWTRVRVTLDYLQLCVRQQLSLVAVCINDGCRHHHSGALQLRERIA